MFLFNWIFKEKNNPEKNNPEKRNQCYNCEYGVGYSKCKALNLKFIPTEISPEELTPRVSVRGTENECPLYKEVVPIKIFIN